MNSYSSQTLNRIILLCILVWMCLVGSSCYWNYSKMKNHQLETVLHTARGFFDQILISRKWISDHGGVYVPVTDNTQPNPHLQDPLRDLPIDKDFHLTKINPAYMVRQISEISSQKANVQFRITSRHPIRPENSPTQRERDALISFEHGLKDTWQVLTSADGLHFFYMAPLITEQSCLKCHTGQPGEIRGGISVTLPQAPGLSLAPLFLGHIFIGIGGFLGIILFWSRLNAAYEIVRQQAVIDSLTGIPNRRHFNERILEEFSRSQRHMEPITLLMCDIDNFKLYNDTYGHKAGDDCLIKVGRSIRNSIRRPSDFCARYGGEEFIVILPETGADGALPVANKILSDIMELGIDHRDSIPLHLVTLSIGTATTIATPDSTYEDLIKEADTALYQAKKDGKNRVEQTAKNV